MRIQDKKFKDVRLTLEFLEDWEQAPKRTRKRIDKIIHMIAISGHLPNSMNVHRVDKESNIWITYVTVTRQHWRLWITWDTEGTLIFLRLLSHDEQDDLLHRTNSNDRRMLVGDFI